MKKFLSNVFVLAMGLFVSMPAVSAAKKVTGDFDRELLKLHTAFKKQHELGDGLLSNPFQTIKEKIKGVEKEVKLEFLQEKIKEAQQKVKDGDEKYFQDFFTKAKLLKSGTAQKNLLKDLAALLCIFLEGSNKQIFLKDREVSLDDSFIIDVLEPMLEKLQQFGRRSIEEEKSGIAEAIEEFLGWKEEEKFESVGAREETKKEVKKTQKAPAKRVSLTEMLKKKIIKERKGKVVGAGELEEKIERIMNVDLKSHWLNYNSRSDQEIYTFLMEIIEESKKLDRTDQKIKERINSFFEKLLKDQKEKDKKEGKKVVYLDEILEIKEGGKTIKVKTSKGKEVVLAQKGEDDWGLEREKKTAVEKETKKKVVSKKLAEKKLTAFEKKLFGKKKTEIAVPKYEFAKKQEAFKQKFEQLLAKTEDVEKETKELTEEEKKQAEEAEAKLQKEIAEKKKARMEKVKAGIKVGIVEQMKKKLAEGPKKEEVVKEETKEEPKKEEVVKEEKKVEPKEAFDVAGEMELLGFLIDILEENLDDASRNLPAVKKRYEGLKQHVKSSEVREKLAQFDKRIKEFEVLVQNYEKLSNKINSILGTITKDLREFGLNLKKMTPDDRSAKLRKIMSDSGTMYDNILELKKIQRDDVKILVKDFIAAHNVYDAQIEKMQKEIEKISKQESKEAELLTDKEIKDQEKVMKEQQKKLEKKKKKEKKRKEREKRKKERAKKRKEKEKEQEKEKVEELSLVKLKGYFGKTPVDGALKELEAIEGEGQVPAFKRARKFRQLKVLVDNLKKDKKRQEVKTKAFAIIEKKKISEKRKQQLEEKVEEIFADLDREIASMEEDITNAINYTDMEPIFNLMWENHVYPAVNSVLETLKSSETIRKFKAAGGAFKKFKKGKHIPLIKGGKLDPNFETEVIEYITKKK